MAADTITVHKAGTKTSSRLAYKSLLIIWTIWMLLLRPSSISELYNRYLTFAFFGLTMVILILYPSPLSFRVTREKATMLLLILISAAYFFGQGLILSSATQIVINASIYVVGTATCIALVLRKENSRFILKVLVSFHFLLSCSAIVSTLLLVANGFNWQALVILRLPEQIYRGGHFVLLPFSEYLSTVRFAGLSIPRFVGIYREPGVSQIYFLTAYFLTYFLAISRQKLVRRVLLIGSILTFSTAALLNLICGLLALFVFNEHTRILRGKISVWMLSGLIVVVGLIVFLLTVPSELNLNMKTSTESASGRWRITLLEDGINLFMEKPIFGHGYYDGFEKDNEGRVVGRAFHGLISAAYQMGLVGLFLYFAAWWYGVFKLGSWRTLCIYLPAFLTLLLSQPTHSTVFVWFLLFLDTSKFRVITAKKLSSGGKTSMNRLAAG